MNEITMISEYGNELKKVDNYIDKEQLISRGWRVLEDKPKPIEKPIEKPKPKTTTKKAVSKNG